MKKCNFCLEEKPLEDFYKKQTGRSGRAALCKRCYCLVQRNRTPKKPKSPNKYIDYLKQQGMYDYYKKAKSFYW